MKYRWAVFFDGELDAYFVSRKEARDYAKWLKKHPSCIDAKTFGYGGHVVVVDLTEEN